METSCNPKYQFIALFRNSHYCRSVMRSFQLPLTEVLTSIQNCMSQNIKMYNKNRKKKQYEINQYSITKHNFFSSLDSPGEPRPNQVWLPEIILKHITLSSAPPDEWSARRIDPHLKTHNTHKMQTSRPPAGFEPTNPANERSQTHATTGILVV
jgi:hypothetical protein